MARYLGAKGFGTLNFALAYTGVLSIFSEMGLSQVIVRELAREKQLVEKYISNAILLKLIFSVFTMILIIEGVNLFDNSNDKKEIVIIIGLSIIIGTFSTMFYSIYQAFERIEFQSFGQILSNSLLYIGTLIAIHCNYNIRAFALLYLFVSLINLIYNLSVISLRFTKPKLKYEFFFWRKLLNVTIPFAITGSSLNAYFWTDTLILSFLKGDEVVGWYNAAYRLISALLFIPYVFNSTIFPLMARYHVSSREYLILSFYKLYKIMTLISFPLAVGTISISDKLIFIIYGSQYSTSIII
jgi:O-antigen/teichoic acid export membrane protein